MILLRSLRLTSLKGSGAYDCNNRVDSNYHKSFVIWCSSNVLPHGLHHATTSEISLAKRGKMKSRQEMIDLGFTIDDTCYPPLAYKGERFDPIEAHYTLTKIEQRLTDQVAAMFTDEAAKVQREQGIKLGFEQMQMMIDHYKAVVDDYRSVLTGIREVAELEDKQGKSMWAGQIALRCTDALEKWKLL